ncbi:MAG: beta-hydroxyacyl-ACP dehydratase [Actinomycetota bacterium]|nr:beta-hydroxyacyl-ACP dehydratase [Actinomycetota bacterium]
MELDGISAILPHRYPMLLVDRVTDVVPGASLTAVKAVTANEPWYAGADARPGTDGHRYPPVLVVESWCQAAGLLAAWGQPELRSSHVMLFGGITGIAFQGRVVPGDVLEHRVRMVRAVSDAAIFEGDTMVGSSPVLEVQRVIMALRPADTIAAASPRPVATARVPGAGDGRR